MNKKISASMMCSDVFYTKEVITALSDKIQFLHIDIMDGIFVPNLGLGIDYINSLKKNTNIFFDYHLMVSEPDKILPLLDVSSNDIISIHYESTYQVQRTLENVKAKGCKVFLAINPATPISSLEEVVYYIDGINMLMVNPGFSGQKIVQSSFKKMEKLYNFLRNEDLYGKLDIEVDGNISIENAKKLSKLGANIFVCGTASIFKKGKIDVDALDLFIKEIINE